MGDIVDTSNSIRWTNLLFDENSYEDYLPDYKDIARQDLTKALGFEPDLRASMAAEVFHRSALFRFDNGELTEEKLKWQRQWRIESIRNLILQEVPEQAHLVQ